MPGRKPAVQDDLLLEYIGQHQPVTRAQLAGRFNIGYHVVVHHINGLRNSDMVSITEGPFDGHYGRSPDCIYLTNRANGQRNDEEKETEVVVVLEPIQSLSIDHSIAQELAGRVDSTLLRFISLGSNGSQTMLEELPLSVFVKDALWRRFLLVDKVRLGTFYSHLFGRTLEAHCPSHDQLLRRVAFEIDNLPSEYDIDRHVSDCVWCGVICDELHQYLKSDS